MASKKIVNNPQGVHTRYNLGYQVVGSTEFGRITPFLCREMVAGDKFKVGANTFVRTAPLACPTFANVDVQLHYAFVPSRLLCDGYYDIMSMQGKQKNLRFPQITLAGIYRLYNVAETYNKLPAKWSGAQTTAKEDFYNLATSFGLPVPLLSDTAIEKQYITLMQFRAYQRFWWDIFRDSEIIPDDQESKYVHTFAGAKVLQNYTDEEYEQFVMRYRTVKDNWLSTLWRTNGQHVPNGDNGQAFVDKEKMIQQMTYSLSALRPIAENLFITEGDSESYNLVGESLISNLQLASGTIVGNDTDNQQIKMAALTNAIPTIDRIAHAMQMLYERCAVEDKRVIDQFYAIYGAVINYLKSIRTQLLHVETFPLQISDVTSTSDTYDSTSDTGLPLGSIGGKAIAAGGSKEFDFTASEPGYLIGVYSIIPKTNFVQGIPREFIRDSRNDIYNPEYERIGFVPVYNRDIYVNESSKSSITTPESVFAYTTPYFEYKTSHDILQGNMRKATVADPLNVGEFSAFHLFRVINPSIESVAIDYSYNFLTYDNVQFNRIFVYQGNKEVSEDHFYVNIHVKVDALRPMGEDMPTIETLSTPHINDKKVLVK